MPTQASSARRAPLSILEEHMSTTDTELSHRLSVATVDRAFAAAMASGGREASRVATARIASRVLDVNNFDAIRISLASPEGDSIVVVWRSHQAGDDQLPHAQAGAWRSLLRAHLRSDQGLGVLLRQVQADSPRRHRLRQVRRRSHALQGAPRAHGPHRTGRAGRAHLVRQGHAEPSRTAARHLAAQPGAGALLRLLPRHQCRR